MAGSDVTALFGASTAHSPSYFTLTRATGAQAGEIADFCIPCNPYFPTPAMFDRLGAGLREILTYYPSSAETVTAELCRLLGLNPATVAMGNGSTELITWIDHLLVRESLAVPVPTFGRWTDQPMETGKRVDMLLLPEARGFALDPEAFVRFVESRGSRVAVVCNPNNPDGGLLSKPQVLGLLDRLQDLDLVVVDESFLEFADEGQETSVAAEAVLRPNVVVLRSLGKNFGLHGVRFGYLVAHPGLAGLIRGALPKWNLNSFAEAVVFMLREHRHEYAESLRRVRGDRHEMIRYLSHLPGLTVYPSQGNFVYVRLPAGVDGALLRDRLLTEHGVLVRECGNKIGSSSRFVRLVVRPQADVVRLVSAMEQVLYGRTVHTPAPAPQAPRPMLAQVPAGPPGVPAPDLPQAVERPPSAVPQAVERPPAARGLVPAAALAPEPAVPPQQPQPVCPDAAGPPAQAARTGLVRAMTAGYTSGTAAIDRLVSGA
ncbi:pyridoxal phosphate-dependent aminotransferase [Streptomyces zhihengii]|uniref:Histidinol-phosphate aminotransferase family protein n=1 Tax=Streptomyces zhihengii TaxID=1818004 RepID=A0ABS2UM06_9ACTN|nr:histidinol-phosphate transaminase [Streptomyces zhihengii]MBM9618505.1 histidinol-phosphate aminotransferase family protein [Streptomyces zhihengii]